MACLSAFLSLDGKHGDVVKLGGCAHETVNVRLDLPQKLFCPQVRTLVQGRQHAAGSIECIGLVIGFRYPVGIHEQGVF